MSKRMYHLSVTPVRGLHTSVTLSRGLHSRVKSVRRPMSKVPAKILFATMLFNLFLVNGMNTTEIAALKGEIKECKDHLTKLEARLALLQSCGNNQGSCLAAKIMEFASGFELSDFEMFITAPGLEERCMTFQPGDSGEKDGYYDKMFETTPGDYFWIRIERATDSNWLYCDDDPAVEESYYCHSQYSLGYFFRPKWELSICRSSDYPSWTYHCAVKDDDLEDALLKLAESKLPWTNDKWTRPIDDSYDEADAESLDRNWKLEVKFSKSGEEKMKRAAMRNPEIANTLIGVLQRAEQRASAGDKDGEPVP